MRGALKAIEEALNMPGLSKKHRAMAQSLSAMFHGSIGLHEEAAVR